MLWGSISFRLLFLLCLLFVPQLGSVESTCGGREVGSLRLGEGDRLGERRGELARDGDSPLTPRERRRSRRGLWSAGLKILNGRELGNGGRRGVGKEERTLHDLGSGPVGVVRALPCLPLRCPQGETL